MPSVIFCEERLQIMLCPLAKNMKSPHLEDTHQAFSLGSMCTDQRHDTKHVCLNAEHSGFVKHTSNKKKFMTEL